MNTLLEAAARWDAVAAGELVMADHERKIGVFVGDGKHPGENRAALYQKTAQSLRLESETGKAHCLCHMAPRDRCPYASDGLKF